MKHEILLGMEYLNENSYRVVLQNVGGTTAGTPPVFRPYVAAVTGTPNVFHSDSYALYAQDTVEFIPKWKATLGIRRDELNAEYNSANSPHLKFGENSYRSALSYHPSDDTHYYLGWSDSFSPTADLYQLTTIPQPPERSDVIELGELSGTGGISGEGMRLARYEQHTIEVVVDRLVRRGGIERRLTDSVETALRLAEGVCVVEIVDQDGKPAGDPLELSHGGEALEPRNFSFNSPYGACETCDGLGTRFEVDPELIIPNRDLSLADGAITPWASGSSQYFKRLVEAVAEELGADDAAPWSKLTKKQRVEIGIG